MLCWGCASASVSVCPSPPFHPRPHPSPNLESDVAPSYSTFPRVSSWSLQSPGSLLGEAVFPREYRAPGGAGQSFPAPFCQHGAGGGSPDQEWRVSAGSPLLSGLPTPLFSTPSAAIVLGWDRTPYLGRLQGFGGGSFCSSQLRTLSIAEAGS